MIQENEIFTCIKANIPDFKLPESNSDICYSCYDLIEAFTAFTSKQIKKADWYHLVKCYQVAEYLYLHGNPQVKNSIENVFMHQISIEIDLSENCFECIELMPPDLLFIRMKQLEAAGL